MNMFIVVIVKGIVVLIFSFLSDREDMMDNLGGLGLQVSNAF